jgi:GATA-binding protein
MHVLSNWITVLTPLLRFFSELKEQQEKLALPSASNAQAHPQLDDQNLFMDDLTFTSPNSTLGSPGDSSGLGHSPASDLHNTSTHAPARAIPIKQERDSSTSINGAPSSAPQNHFEMRVQEGEFGYVQRRVRKTSVDERRVRVCLASSIVGLSNLYAIATQAKG